MFLHQYGVKWIFRISKVFIMDKFLRRLPPSSNTTPPVVEVSTDEDEPSKKKKKYFQKYKPEWESSREWLKCFKMKAFCILCNCSLGNDISYLDRHSKMPKHLNAAKTKSSNNLKQLSVIESVSKRPASCKKLSNEISTVMYCIQHNLSLRTMSSLPQLLNFISPSETRINCGATKAVGMVNNILGPYATESIAKELRSTSFSLILDEGTDISMNKCLVLIVRYLPSDKCTVVDRFFGLLKVEDATAQGLYDLTVNFFNSMKIPLNNMIGLATDNASVMKGRYNSVKQKFEHENNNLFYLGCTCHTLNLCSSAASKQLPARLEKLVRNVYGFFSHSTKRRSDFRNFQDAFNTLPHNILGACETRWLPLETAVERLIEQWEPLKHYFLLFSFEELHESSASNILEELNDTNYAYFLFLNYILKKINVFNKEYQSKGTIIHLLYSRITTFFKELLQNFVALDFISLDADYKNESIHMPFSLMYFGLKCNAFLENHDLLNDVIKKDLLNYYICLCDELKKRFDFSNHKLKLLEYLDPEKIQSNDMPTILPLLKAFPSPGDCEEKLNSEWRSFILFNKEKVKEIFEGDLVRGWKALREEENMFNELLFSNLSRYMCKLAILPHSSAAAERSFSVMKIIKTEQRNRLKTETISNLIFAKELCVGDELYIPPNDLIIFAQKFNFINGSYISSF